MEHNCVDEDVGMDEEEDCQDARGNQSPTDTHADTLLQARASSTSASKSSAMPVQSKRLIDVRKVIAQAAGCAILKERDVFSKLLLILESVAEEAPMVFSSAGLSCEAMNSSHTAMYTLLMPPACFSDWKYRRNRAVEVCFNIKTLIHIFKCATNKECIALVLDPWDESLPQPDRIRVLLWDPEQEDSKGFQRSSYSLPLKSRECEAPVDFSHLPDLVSFTMDATVLNKLVQSYKNLGQVVCFEFVPNEGLSLTIESDVHLVDGGTSFEANACDVIDTPDGKPVTARFLVALLSLLTVANSQSDWVRILVKNEQGVTTLQYKAFGHGHLQFCIAPRIG